MTRLWMTTAAVTLAGASMASANVVTLDFEGLGDQVAIEEAYNGGTAADGTSLTDFGVSFAGNALSIIDADAGGTGNFANEPTPDTVMFFLSGGSTIMNVAAGFETGFSFFYSSVSSPGSVSVFDGVDGTGDELATLTLDALGSAGNGDPNGTFDTWAPIGVNFAGTARSVDFAGVINQIGFDQITFGSETPTPPPTPNAPIPLPATLPLALGAIGLLGLIRRRA